MSTLWILCVGVGYLALYAVLLFVARPRSAAGRLDKVAGSVGLPVSAEIEPTVRSTENLQIRVAFISIVIGLIAATLGMFVGHTGSVVQMFWIDFTISIAAASLGSAIATLVHEDSRQRVQVRLARLRAVSIVDYRAPLEQWLPRIAVAVAVVGFIVRIAVDPGGASGVPPFLYVYAVLMVATLVICEIAGRVLVRRGQPAGSAIELAWDDALRSRALSAIAVSPFFLGAYFGFVTLAFYPPTHSAGSAPGSIVEISLDLAAAILLLAWGVIAMATKPQQRYLRRLWPELAGSSVGAPQS
jgi:uncharacterized membrane protein (DUF485 family)